MTIESALQSISSDNVAGSLKSVSETLREVIHEAESMTFDLSSPILHELGLVEAIKEYLSTEIRNKRGIKVDLDIGDSVNDPEERVKDILFRVTRELIINVVKHAQASRIKVSISESGGCLKLRIEDDGIGFDPGTIDKVTRFGLFSVQEQLESIGGRLEIESTSDQGTTATVILSLQDVMR
jgi:signal transduction histidine kinase